MVSANLRRLLGIAVIVVLSGIAYSAYSYSNYTKPNLSSGSSNSGYATDATFTDIDGKQFSLSNFKGKIVILEFTSTTCESCVTLHTTGYLHQFYEKYKDKVVIVTISIAGKKVDTPDRMLAYREHFKVEWPMTWDEGQKLMIAMKVPSLFTHIWLDQNGVPRYYNAGGIEVVKTEYPQIVQIFERQDWAALKEFQGEPPVEIG